MDWSAVEFIVGKQMYLEHLHGCNQGIQKQNPKTQNHLMHLKKLCDPNTFSLLLECAEQEFLDQLPEYRNWYPLLGRFHCFHSLLHELKGIYRITPECRTSESRLIQLLKQAILYQLSVIQTQVGQEVRVDEMIKEQLPILRNVV